MKKRELLYIEDNFHNRRIVRKILERQGFQLYEAEDGLIGFNLIREMKPPLVLLDISLPGMDGIEIAQRVKADPNLNHIFIIALTASAMQGDRERFLEAGCDDYMSKPFKALDLAQMVTEHFEALESRQAFLDSIEDPPPETFVPAWEMPRRPVDIDTVRPSERQPESAALFPEAQEEQEQVEQESQELAPARFETNTEHTEIPDGIAAAEAELAGVGEPVETETETDAFGTGRYGGAEDLDTTSLDPAMLAKESTAVAHVTGDITELPADALETSEEAAQPEIEDTYPAVEETQPAVEETQPVVEEIQPVVEEIQPAVEETHVAGKDHYSEPVFQGEIETSDTTSVEESTMEAPMVSETDPAAIEQGLRGVEDEPSVWLPETEISSEGEQIKPEEPEAETFRTPEEDEVKPGEVFTQVEPIQESASEWVTAPVDEETQISSEPTQIDQVELEGEILSPPVAEPPRASFAKIHTAPLDEKLVELVKDNSHSGSSADQGDIINLSRNERNKQIAANILGMINPETIRPVEPNVGDDEIETR